MKILHFFALLLLLFNIKIKAQDNSKKVKLSYNNNAVLTIASSASIFSKLGFIDSTNNIYRSQKIPPLNINYDFKSNSKFTIGIALHFEQFQFYQLDTTASVSLNRNRNLVFRGELSKKYLSFNNFNPSIRLLYHKIKNANDLYAGGRISYTIFSNISNKNSQYNELLINGITLQLLFGYRRYYNNWGFNIEGAMGRPYWFLAGVNYKIIKSE